jgi:carnitine O-acetyltransferase
MKSFLKESTNRDCFDLIERSIFILCLDKKVDYATNIDSSTKGNSDPLVQNAFQMLHGCGSTNNSGNRWYDKTMQFVVSENGVCGLNYEHSTAEGIVVIELTEHLFRYMAEKRKQKLYRMPSICELPVPHKLRWKISDSVNKWIEKSKRSFDE